MRTIIIHYHLFKNAGSSLDALFKKNFGNSFFEEEFEQHAVQTGNVPLVAEWISNNKTAKVLSSHSAHMPPPDIPNVQILPVVMLRHPLLRFKSAYLFERKQNGIQTRGVRYAKENDFKGYLEAYLATPNNINCRNYQACHLTPRSAWFCNELEKQALMALSSLPFVGVVERFDQSILALERWLQVHFPAFKGKSLEENVGDQRSLSDIERLEEIKNELGQEFYRQISKLNSIDILLHGLAIERLSGFGNSVHY